MELKNSKVWLDAETSCELLYARAYVRVYARTVRM